MSCEAEAKAMSTHSAAMTPTFGEAACEASAKVRRASAHCAARIQPRLRPNHGSRKRSIKGDQTNLKA